MLKLSNKKNKKKKKIFSFIIDYIKFNNFLFTGFEFLSLYKKNFTSIFKFY